ncbi:MAG: MFS transporter [Pseudanabaenaceae cyanobacterium]
MTQSPPAPPIETVAPPSPSLFRNRNFLAIWGSQVFSQIADKIFLTLAIAIVAERFQRPGEPISGWVSAVMVAFTIPAMVLGSVAGVWVDRWFKKWVLAISNLLRGLVVIAIPVALAVAQQWGGPQAGFWTLLAIVFVVSALTQVFTPAEQAAIALTVSKEKLLAANSVCATTVMGALVLGFATGEPLLNLSNQWLGESGKDFLVGGCYLLAALVLVRAATGEKWEDLQPHDVHFWEDLWGGLACIGARPVLRLALVQLVGTYSIVAALTVLAVRLAEIMPELDPDQFGFLLAVASMGIGGGALLVGRFGKGIPRSRLALTGSSIMGMALLALAAIGDRLWPSVGAIAVLGVGAGLSVIPMQTAMQEETPEEVRGKVFGLQNNAINIALSLPLSLAGVAESLWGLPTVLVGWGGGAVALGVLAHWLDRA